MPPVQDKVKVTPASGYHLTNFFCITLELLQIRLFSKAPSVGDFDNTCPQKITSNNTQIFLEIIGFRTTFPDI